jgi:hypothetical protein
MGKRSALMVTLAIGIAGCGGSDESTDTTPAFQAARTTTTQASPVTTRQVAVLQESAGDLVRETTYRDRRGAVQAYKETQDRYEQVQEAVRSKAPGPAKEIESGLDATNRALQGDNVPVAATNAKRVLKAVNESAPAVTGKPSGPETGLAAQLRQMKAAARDVQQEIGRRDKAGTRRALTAFAKLYSSARDRIEAKVAATAGKIDQALREAKTAAAKGDAQGLKEAAQTLQGAVDEAIAAVR